MPSLRSILLASFSFACIASSQSSPEPSPNHPDQHPSSFFDFQELLNALPAESLHAALHKHLDGKYTDGAYEHDRAAVHAVHDEDPPTATKVLAEAALDLIKRQNGNGTVVSTTSTTSTTSVVSTTTAPAPTTTTTSAAPILATVTLSTTDSAGSATVVTTSVVSSATVSVAVAVTTTNSRGSTVTTSATVAAAVVTSNGKVTTAPASTFNAAAPQTLTTTDAAGNSVVLTGVTSGAVLTATDARGSTFVTTYTPGRGVVQSLVLKTTTLPDGQVVTLTSFAAVEQQTATSTGPPSSSSTPKLQNGADGFRTRGLGADVVALMGGALGAALLL